ncbi:signal peptidase I [Candidatus Bathyarchaeota archaeon]|nr:signal peptidase I [Candidatus Bathyarchaeota archaeon]
MSKLKLIVTVALTVALSCFISLNLIRMYPSLIGYKQALTIKGGSMKPFLSPGDLILVGEAAPEDISVGDIITVDRPEGAFTHRVVEVKHFQGETYFRTKGDANNAPDPFMTPYKMVIGEVEEIIPTHIIFTPIGFILFLAFPFLAFSLNIFRSLLQESKKRSRRGLIKWRKGKMPVMSMASMLLLLITLASSANVLSPLMSSGSFTEFSDLEDVIAFITSGTWKKTHTAGIDIRPDTLKLTSGGDPITCHIFLEENLDIHSMKPTTIRIISYNRSELVNPIYAEDAAIEYDEDGDTILGLKVQFERASIVDSLLSAGFETDEKVEMSIEGLFINGDYLQGSDIIELENDG